MEWNAYLVAIRRKADAARVHIIERRYLEPTAVPPISMSASKPAAELN